MVGDALFAPPENEVTKGGQINRRIQPCAEVRSATQNSSRNAFSANETFGSTARLCCDRKLSVTEGTMRVGSAGHQHSRYT